MEAMELKRIASEAAFRLASIEAESKTVEAELQKWACEIGREAVRILQERGTNLSPDDTDRLLRLLVLRMILQKDPFVQSLARSLTPLRQLLLGQTVHETAPPDIELEP